MLFLRRLPRLAFGAALLTTILLNVSCEGTQQPATTETTTSTITTTQTPVTTTAEPQTTTTTTIHTLPLDPSLDPTIFYVSYIITTPDTATIAAGGSQLYTVTAYDYEGNSFDVTRDCDFFITDGAGGSWIYNEYISENTGTWQIITDYWNPVDGTEFWRDEATLIVK